MSFSEDGVLCEITVNFQHLNFFI